MVFTVYIRLDVAAIKGAFLLMNTLVGGGWKSVDLGHLQLLRHLGADVQRVGVVVGIRVVDQPHVEPALAILVSCGYGS